MFVIFGCLLTAKVVVPGMWPRCYALRWMKNCGDEMLFICLLSPPKLALMWSAVWCKIINDRLVPKTQCSGAIIEPITGVTTSTTALQGGAVPKTRRRCLVLWQPQCSHFLLLLFDSRCESCSCVWPVPIGLQVFHTLLLQGTCLILYTSARSGHPVIFTS